MTRPTRSGPYCEESERNTTRVVLRLSPVVAERLRAIASAWRCPVSAVIEPALDALDARPTQPATDGEADDRR